MGRNRAKNKGIPKEQRLAKAEFTLRKDAALKALKEFQRQGSFKGRPPAFADMLSDESDRGAVILVGSLIEDLLADKIIEKFPNGEENRDLLLGGFLAGFQDKVTMARALGIIDQGFSENLEVLRSMRNACAHSKVDIHFDTPVLREAFYLLFHDENVAEMVSSDRTFMRTIFNFSAVFHFEILLGATRDQATATFSWLLADATAQAKKVAAQRAASREKRPAQSKKPNPPKDRKDARP